MNDRVVLEEPTASFQLGDDILVGVLNPPTAILRNFRGEHAVVVHRVRHGNALFQAGVVILFTEGGRHVHDAGAAIRRNMIRVNHAERVWHLRHEVRKERFVFHPDQLGTFADTEHFDFLGGFECRLKQGLSEDVSFAGGLVPRADIINIPGHGQGQVAREGPGSGGPGEECCVRLAEHGKAYRDGGILNVLVIEACLEIGKRGRNADRIRDDLVAFIDEALLIKLLENPPDALHEAHVHREIGVLHVDPAAHPANRPLPLLGIALNDSTAGCVVFVDAEFEHLFAALDFERFIDLLLNR